MPWLAVKRVRIYTDGACIGNPGPGGWAAIEALRALRGPAEVDLFTDSAYLKRGITEWLPRWKEQGWKRREGKRLVAVANEDLWRELDRLTGIYRVRFHWVAGHAGHPENERADQLARTAIPKD
jgi:ribonuclease HI